MDAKKHAKKHAEKHAEKHADKGSLQVRRPSHLTRRAATPRLPHTPSPVLACISRTSLSIAEYGSAESSVSSACLTAMLVHVRCCLSCSCAACCRACCLDGVSGASALGDASLPATPTLTASCISCQQGDSAHVSRGQAQPA